MRRLVSITVERRLVTLLAGSEVGARVCITDPDNCCPTGSGGGSGSGTGSSGGTVQTDCCSSPWPTLLYGTVTSLTGDWVGLPADLVLEYGETTWQVTTPGWDVSCVAFLCLAGAPYFGAPAQPGWSCSPLVAQFNLTSVDCAGRGTGSCTLIVTE